MRLHIFDKNNHNKFLVDSGSVISIIPRSFIRQPLKLSDTTLHAVNNTIIRTYDQKSITLNFSLKRELKWNFIIADISSAILGADFLGHYGLLVDIKNKSLIDPMTQISTQGQLRCTVAVISTIGNNTIFHNILRKYISVTLPSRKSQKIKHDVQYQIIKTGQPIAERPRRLSGEKAAAAREEINTILHDGILRPSKSPWASPIYLVKKKTGGWRMCGDFRK